MTVYDLNRFKDLPAVISEQGETYLYSDLDKMQKKFASYIKKRALICIFADNDIGSLVVYISSLLNRFVPILLSNKIIKAYGDFIVKEYHPEYIYMSSEQYESSKDWLNGYEEKILFLDYVLLQYKWQNKINFHKDLACLLPTSGSTGKPKLVRLSYKNILTNTVSICDYMKITKNDRVITSLPISYTYGLSMVNILLFSGGSIFLTKESVVNSSFWKHMKEYNITILAGVPYTFECMKKFNVSVSELKRLRLMTQAGGKLSVELHKYWGKCAQQVEKRFFVMYGQTEATARIAYLPYEDCLRKIGSVGIAVSGCEIIIADENGKEILEPSKEGEIVCKGEHVSLGYAEKISDLMLGDINRGWLHTKDIGYFDEEGYLYITGRRSRFAKIYGRRIDLTYIEITAEKIYGKETDVLSDDSNIYIYIDKELEMKDIKLLEKITGIERGTFIVRSREDLPRKYNGKIDYKEI